MVEYPKQKTKDYTKQLFFAFVLVMIPTCKSKINPPINDHKLFIICF